MDKRPLVTPKPAPELNIPPSDSTVTVRVMDTGTTILLDPPNFWGPSLKGFDGVYAPIYCFLISHGTRHIVFDLGVRTDWENLAPDVVSMIKSITAVVNPDNRDIAQMLTEDEGGLGIKPKDVEAVIWSHSHFDHVGDPSTFPTTTDLVVGPGVKAASWPGWPSNPEGKVLDADAEGRVVREVRFGDEDGQGGLMIGRFRAMDYFGDGSFYLLDAPGHAVGHMCGLARVTPSSAAGGSSFVFMGADGCHHAGVLRPTEYLPLPGTVGSCPGALLQQLHPHGSAVRPFFSVSPQLFPDHETALETVRKMEEIDASEDILVVIAHDLSLRGQIDFYPKDINGWKKTAVRDKTRWLFCRDFEGGIEGNGE